MPLIKYTFGSVLMIIIFILCVIMSIFIWDLEYIKRCNKLMDYFLGAEVDDKNIRL